MYVKARVAAGMKKEAFVKVSEDTFQISVREPAERNLANARVRELIAGHFGIPIGKTRIIAGHHSPSKILSIEV